jgi:hypothetical protein
MFALRPYGSPPSVIPTNRKTFNNAGHNCSIESSSLMPPSVQSSESSRHPRAR